MCVRHRPLHDLPHQRRSHSNPPGCTGRPWESNPSHAQCPPNAADSIKKLARRHPLGHSTILRRIPWPRDGNSQCRTGSPSSPISTWNGTLRPPQSRRNVGPLLPGEPPSDEGPQSNGPGPVLDQDQPSDFHHQGPRMSECQDTPSKGSGPWEGSRTANDPPSSGRADQDAAGQQADPAAAWPMRYQRGQRPKAITSPGLSTSDTPSSTHVRHSPGCGSPASAACKPLKSLTSIAFLSSL